MDWACEWLEADGHGGFASGTAGLTRTRRYHALLLTETPNGRQVLLNGLEVFAETATGRYALSAQAYLGGVVSPDGRTYLEDFTALPWPRWRFRLPDGTEIRHELFVTRATQETVLRWWANRPVRLTIRPLMSGRDYHALHHENPTFDFTAARQDGALAWHPYPGVPAVTARGSFIWEPGAEWYRQFSYAVDLTRGLDDGEDLASPGTFVWTATTEAVLILRAQTPGTLSPETLAATEAARRSRAARDIAADSYLIARRESPSILAGFPWFTDWGRDTFIAMRGLLIARGRLQEAAEILLAWSEHVSEGMLPNRFPDGDGAPEYNSADASLWFIVAVHELSDADGASRAVTNRLRAAAVTILEGYTEGTRFGIAADPRDGLLRAGVPGVQVTWMDAKIGDHVVTPRIGKPVELQALWVNALAIAGQWPGNDRWMAAALRARDSVVGLFPDRATGGLIDVLDVDGVRGAQDRRVRPNQVLAAGGLPIPVLTPRLIAGVVTLAERTLLTPIGLRTLAPDDPDYVPHYRGGPVERDMAYHQGTAWPWLLGPFVAAWLANEGNTAASRDLGRARFLPALHAHLHIAGLGHVSEVTDGDEPYTPGGCPFQAWSLGELIRIEAMLGAPNGS